MTPVFRVAALAGIVAIVAAAQFKSDVRLVEVYAYVFDQKGNHVDGLPRDQFRILDEGSLQPIFSFEAERGDVTCAILLDTTGSMQGALPSVKNAVSNFLDQMRDGDSMGIFGFNSALVTLQDFTGDRAAARRAVLRTRAVGGNRAIRRHRGHGAGDQFAKRKEGHRTLHRRRRQRERTYGRRGDYAGSRRRRSDIRRGGR